MPPSPQAAYAAKKRTDHQVHAIRPSMLLAPDSPRPRRDAGAAAGGADVIELPAPTPRRDGTERLGAIVPLDDHNRIFAAKVLGALGWTADTELVAEVRGRTAVVREGRPTRATAWLLPTGVDKKSRLRLPPGVKGALQVRCAEQVVACAVPATGELHLSAAADALQALSGAIEAQATDDPTHDVSAPELPRTRVRPAVAFAD